MLSGADMLHSHLTHKMNGIKYDPRLSFLQPCCELCLYLTINTFVMVNNFFGPTRVKSALFLAYRAYQSHVNITVLLVLSSFILPGLTNVKYVAFADVAQGI